MDTMEDVEQMDFDGVDVFDCDGQAHDSMELDVCDNQGSDSLKFDEQSYDDYNSDAIQIYNLNNIIMSISKKKTKLQQLTVKFNEHSQKFYADWNGKYKFQYSNDPRMQYWNQDIGPFLNQCDQSIILYRQTSIRIDSECNDSIDNFLNVLNELDPCYGLDIDTIESQSDELISDIDKAIKEIESYINDLDVWMQTLVTYYHEWHDSVPDELIKIIMDSWDNKYFSKYLMMAMINKRWRKIIMTKYRNQYENAKRKRIEYVSRCRTFAYNLGKSLLSRKHHITDMIGMNEQHIIHKYKLNFGYQFDHTLILEFSDVIKNIDFTIYRTDINYYEDNVKTMINKHYDKILNFCKKMFPTYSQVVLNIMMDTASAVIEDDNVLLKIMS